MKKIPQNAAIETLQYIMRPDQKLIIKDRANMYDTGKVVFDDVNKNLIGYDYAKIMKSKIRDIGIQDDAIVLTIEMSNDEY